jgi:DNA-binding HxlR family transcriptional regulator
MAILSMRLKTLEKDGFFKKTDDEASSGIVRWTLTEKGEDALPILMCLIAFGPKWYAKEVFEDKVLLSLNEIFTRPEAQEMVEIPYEA